MGEGVGPSHLTLQRLRNFLVLELEPMVKVPDLLEEPDFGTVILYLFIHILHEKMPDLGITAKTAKIVVLPSLKLNGFLIISGVYSKLTCRCSDF